MLRSNPLQLLLDARLFRVLSKEGPMKEMELWVLDSLDGVPVHHLLWLLGLLVKQQHFVVVVSDLTCPTMLPMLPAVLDEISPTLTQSSTVVLLLSPAAVPPACRVPNAMPLCAWLCHGRGSYGCASSWVQVRETVRRPNNPSNAWKTLLTPECVTSP